MTTIQSYWDRLGAWLMQHWLSVGAVALSFLFFTVLLTGKKSQDAKEAVEQRGNLSRREIKRKDKAIAQKDDSIRTQTVIIKQIVHVRDSLKVVAKVHDARADSLIKTIAHESTTPDPDATPERVALLLSEYKPKAWALEAADSLR